MTTCIKVFGFKSRYGGDRFEEHFASLLAKNNELAEFRAERSRGMSTVLHFILLILQGTFTRSSVILRPFSMPIYRRNMVVIFHHYDPLETPLVPRLLETIDLWLLRFLNKPLGIKVVVVSRFWRDWLLTKGFADISIVYNESKLYDGPTISRTYLAEEYRLDESKKWIFLGAACTKKGGHEILNELTPDDLETFEFVASGNVDYDKADEFKAAKIIWIAQEDYMSFLSECDWVVAHSRLREGWCRVVVEAGLSGAAVIGTGIAGMAEALDGIGGEVSKSAEKTLEIIRRSGIGRVEQAEKFVRYLEEQNKLTIKNIEESWFQ